jgi:hypothetical protein
VRLGRREGGEGRKAGERERESGWGEVEKQSGGRAGQGRGAEQPRPGGGGGWIGEERKGKEVVAPSHNSGRGQHASGCLISLSHLRLRGVGLLPSLPPSLPLALSPSLSLKTLIPLTSKQKTE